MKRRTFLFLAILSALFLSCTAHRQEQLQTHIRNGHELFERKLYSEAMEVYSEAEEMALKSGDMYSLGVTYQNIAHIYNAIGSHNEEISYLDKAIRAFEDAGKPYNSLHVYFESGAARYNLQDYASAEKIFRTAMYQAHQAADTLLEAACLEAYAALCLERSEQDPALAINMLARKANELKCPLTSKDRGMLAYAYALTGDHTLAEEWAEKAVKSAENDTEKAEARFREYQIAYRAGNTEKALEALEQVMEYNNSISAASLKKTVASTRQDYEEQQRLNAMYRLRTMRLVTAFIILFAMAISFALIGYIRYRRIEAEKALAEEKAETEKYMTIAEELQARLRTASKRLPSEKHMSIARFDLLERLCEQYYVYEGTENLQGKILKEVKSVIDGLRKDSKTIKGLEIMLDRNCSNLVARLREQMPKLKEEDVRLFIFAASGFSSTTISTILEKEKGIIYNRIWRLKGKISASDAPDKDDFLQSLNS
jgi:tetratricopeptide (TPR) repeat protein